MIARFYFLIALLLFAAAPALAQEAVGLPSDGNIMSWVTWAAALLVPISSILAAIFPDDHAVMKIVNFFAINLGKAKNDPGAQ